MKHIRLRHMLCFALCLCLLLCMTPAAAADGGARVEFKATAPDTGGYFTVTMTAYEMTFRVFQFALKYDTAVVKPVGSDGADADSFWDFASLDAGADWLSSVGTELNAETGLIDFSGYVMPGKTGGALNENFEIASGAEGVKLFSFRFKVTGEGEMGLEIASAAKGEPYRPACPDGVIVANNAGGDVKCSVVFSLPESLGTGGAVDYTGGSGGEAAKAPATVAERLENTVILQIGNYAAAKNGALCHIYPGEKLAVPVIDANGRTMVPVRFVAESLGAKVDWEADTRTVVISLSGKTIRMAIGSGVYTVNGVEKTMDTAAELPAHGRTMVPIRFVAEALGKAVEWDAVNRLVVITEKEFPWDNGGTLEKSAVEGITLIFSPLMRDYV